MLDADTLKSILRYDPETGIFTWLVGRQPGAVAGGFSPKGYVRIHIRNVKYMGHRLAWLYVYGEWPIGLLDHKDGNRANNSLTNLRLATANQNQYNRKPTHGRTLPKGVVYKNDPKRKNKFGAQISVNKIRIYLGHYPTAEEAHEVYKQACVLYHGEFLSEFV